MLKALIFDVDGTLADTERDGHRIAFNMAFNDAGLDWHWDEELYGELLAVTGGKERMTHFIKTHRPNEWSDDMPNRIVALQAKKTQFYTQLLSEGKIPLRTGVARLLNEARAAGLRLAIATTTTPENVTALLTHTLGAESIQWFDVIAAGDIVPAKKPAPDIYHYALTKMGLHANECLAFEDSYNGIQSTNQAGIKTIVTVNGYTEADDFNGAMVVLSDLGEPTQAMTVLTGNLADPYVSVATLNKLHQNFVS
ncbi:MAG: HAD family hydrolase [Thiotrichales bacterium]|jgi:HAD superfamily hydrolase (TIGR01509 family)|nr:HAD family hydrolase [Thiotrichales bacterium]